MKNGDKKGNTKAKKPAKKRGPLNVIQPPSPPARRGARSKLEVWMTGNNGKTYKEFLQYIRMGAYEFSAAGRFGIHTDTLYRWLRIGRNRNQHPYRQFFLDVTDALCAAQSDAETEVKRSNPLAYLKNGPPRRRAIAEGLPGWGDDPTHVIVEDVQSPWGGVASQRIADGRPPYGQPVQCPVDATTLAEAYKELERLGFIAPGPQAQILFPSKVLTEEQLEEEDFED